MPLMVPLSKTCGIQMLAFGDQSPLHHLNGKRHFMVSLLSVGVMAGKNGRTGLLIRKEATKRYQGIKIYF
jgi:hypothetical protein